MYCSVRGCKSRWGKPPGVHYYAFPNRRESTGLLNKWLERTSRTSFTPSRYSSICSRHFTEDDYEAKSEQLGGVKHRPKLKPTAIPSVHVCEPEKKTSISIEDVRRKMIMEDFEESEPDTSMSDDLFGNIKVESDDEVTIIQDRRDPLFIDDKPDVHEFSHKEEEEEIEIKCYSLDDDSSSKQLSDSHELFNNVNDSKFERTNINAVLGTPVVTISEDSITSQGSDSSSNSNSKFLTSKSNAQLFKHSQPSLLNDDSEISEAVKCLKERVFETIHASISNPSSTVEIDSTELLAKLSFQLVTDPRSNRSQKRKTSIQKSKLPDHELKTAGGKTTGVKPRNGKVELSTKHLTSGMFETVQVEDNASELSDVRSRLSTERSSPNATLQNQRVKAACWTPPSFKPQDGKIELSTDHLNGRLFDKIPDAPTSNLLSERKALLLTDERSRSSTYRLAPFKHQDRTFKVVDGRATGVNPKNKEIESLTELLKRTLPKSTEFKAVSTFVIADQNGALSPTGNGLVTTTVIDLDDETDGDQQALFEKAVSDMQSSRIGGVEEVESLMETDENESESIETMKTVLCHGSQVIDLDGESDQEDQEALCEDGIHYAQSSRTEDVENAETLTEHTEQNESESIETMKTVLCHDSQVIDLDGESDQEDQEAFGGEAAHYTQSSRTEDVENAETLTEHAEQNESESIEAMETVLCHGSQVIDLDGESDQEDHEALCKEGIHYAQSSRTDDVKEVETEHTEENESESIETMRTVLCHDSQVIDLDGESDQEDQEAFGGEAAHYTQSSRTEDFENAETLTEHTEQNESESIKAMETVLCHDNRFGTISCSITTYDSEEDYFSATAHNEAKPIPVPIQPIKKEDEVEVNHPDQGDFKLVTKEEHGLLMNPSGLINLETTKTIDSVRNSVVNSHVSQISCSIKTFDSEQNQLNSKTCSLESESCYPLRIKKENTLPVNHADQLDFEAAHGIDSLQAVSNRLGEMSCSMTRFDSERNQFDTTHMVESTSAVNHPLIIKKEKLLLNSVDQEDLEGTQRIDSLPERAFSNKLSEKSGSITTFDSERNQFHTTTHMMESTSAVNHPLIIKKEILTLNSVDQEGFEDSERNQFEKTNHVVKSEFVSNNYSLLRQEEELKGDPPEATKAIESVPNRLYDLGSSIITYEFDLKHSQFDARDKKGETMPDINLDSIIIDEKGQLLVKRSEHNKFGTIQTIGPVPSISTLHGHPATSNSAYQSIINKGARLRVLLTRCDELTRKMACVMETTAAKRSHFVKSRARGSKGKLKRKNEEGVCNRPIKRRPKLKKEPPNEPRFETPTDLPVDISWSFSKTSVDPNNESKPTAAESRVICSTCNASFPNSLEFLHHSKVHTGGKVEYRCKHCGSLFKRKATLAAHLKSHVVVSPYSCRICGLIFVNPDDLSRHSSTHVKIKCLPKREVFILPKMANSPNIVYGNSRDEIGFRINL